MDFESLAPVLATFFLLGIFFFGTQCTMEISRLSSVNKCIALEREPDACKAAFDKVK